MIFYGRRASNIGEFDVHDTECQYCGSKDTQQISVFGKYLQVYFIPIIPFGKEAVAECTHCKRTISEKEFPQDLKMSYRLNKDKVKRPIWHYTGLAAIVMLFVVMNIMDAVKEVDPREALLNADRDKMTVDPVLAEDTLSYYLKMYCNDIVEEAIKPEDFKFYTTRRGDDILVLAQMQKLKDVKKEGRTQVLDMIDEMLDADIVRPVRNKYIGVIGATSFMLIRTPTAFENGTFKSPDALFEFYGPKPPKQE